MKSREGLVGEVRELLERLDATIARLSSEMDDELEDGNLLAWSVLDVRLATTRAQRDKCARLLAALTA